MITIPKFDKKELPKFLNGHWSFPEQMNRFTDDYSGFVYVIRDRIVNRLYLGLKNYNGSNWKNYCSSSRDIKLVLDEVPHENFDFICLEQYKTKSGLKYAETWSLCYVNAPYGPLWYNTRIEKITWNITELPTQRHINRLNRCMDFEDNFDDF